MQQTMLLTNRDIYARVIALEEQFGGELLPSLEAYLLSFWSLVVTESTDLIDVYQLLSWLERAFEHEPPPFQPHWLDIPSPQPFRKRIATFSDWEDVILFQIADLHRMAESGDLTSPNRYEGITSPSGTQWYNFDPITYLECAVRGTMGGHRITQLIRTEHAATHYVRNHTGYVIRTFTWADMILMATFGQMYA
ncbi:MAG: hypothetical protein KC421_07110 [Anaerolineales bacterium]|nr:hypothetical protein [Anaerolineales bacterium]